MTLGGSIALLVLGAILYFAVRTNIGGVDLDLVGIILMVAGAVGLVLSLFARGRVAGGGHPH